MSNLNSRQFGENEYETLYHLTDNAKFSPDPSYTPQDNTVAIESRARPGLYTGDPERWINGSGYIRPFVAEMRVPKGAAEKGRWGGENFIPGEKVASAEVTRVIPTDAFARERYGSPGWIEEHHGTAFDTGEKITLPDVFSGPGTRFPDYRYDGPDAREMDHDTVKAHTKRARAYQKWNDDPKNH